MVYYVANILQIYETEDSTREGKWEGMKKEKGKKERRKKKGTKRKIVMWYLNKQNKLLPFVYAK